MIRSLAAVLTLLLFISAMPVEAADAAFRAWLEKLRPEAEAAGVSRATFDAATVGLEPDLTLPELELPGRKQPTGRGQAEFVAMPSDYLSEKSLAPLTTQGRALLAQHRATLAAIEQRFGVPGPVVLAIYGRETGYGKAKLPYNAVRVLATQAYIGRRAHVFRKELIVALKLVERGETTVEAMRSSWAGAMGLTQFMPSDFERYAQDFDGDGRRDIWRSVPDALASVAAQLAGNGWVRGERWSYEVKPPAKLDCTIAEPETTATIGDWLRRGYVPLAHKPDGATLKAEASLFLPEGIYGPAFLTPKNYYVLKGYNFADLYVLFVGHLSDRIAGGGAGFETPWAKLPVTRSADVEAMQKRLAELKLYADKIDGKAGMKTRVALGKYQKAAGLKVDCWPSPDAIKAMMAG